MRTMTVLLAVLVGCAADSPVAPPPVVPLSDVTGTYQITCHQASGDVDTPLDLSQRFIQAFIPDTSAAGFHVASGTGKADGTFLVRGVPTTGSYLLQLGTSDTNDLAYFVTDQHALELHGEREGRCMPVPVKPADPTKLPSVALGVGSMTAFNQQTDRVELDSFGLAVGTSVAFAVVKATTLQGTLTWSPALPLIDATAGDDLFIVHSRTDQVTDPTTKRLISTQHVIDVFNPANTTLKDAATTMVRGNFQQQKATHTGTLAIDHAQFEASSDPATRPGTLSVAVLAQPGKGSGTGAGAPGSAAILLDVSVQPLSDLPIATTTMSAFGYADSFPAAWTRSLAISYDRFHPVQLVADPTAPTGIAAGYHERAAFAGTVAASAKLAAPTGITVAGIDFATGGKVDFPGDSPVVVRWSPVSGAQLYRFTLAYFSTDGTLLQTVPVTTSDTQLALPAAAIQSGTLYQFVLEAIQTPVAYAAGELVPPVVPQAAAGAPSGRFRFMPSCGDGVVQPGEDCDTGGESATCNADCTKAVCGDGVVNAAAGEACDAIEDSLSCTASCKLP